MADVTCTESEFDCGESVCVPLDSRCNGTDECPNGTDELNCPGECQILHYSPR